MLVKVSAKSGVISSDAKDYASHKVLKLSRYYDNIVRTEVILDVDANNKYRCEIIVYAPRGKVIVVNSVSITATAAVDDATERMARRLSEFKDMLRAKSAKDTQRVTRRLVRKLKQLGKI
jgi:ribosomal subunit interface protein